MGWHDPSHIFTSNVLVVNAVICYNTTTTGNNMNSYLLIHTRQQQMFINVHLVFADASTCIYIADILGSPSFNFGCEKALDLMKRTVSKLHAVTVLNVNF